MPALNYIISNIFICGGCNRNLHIHDYGNICAGGPGFNDGNGVIVFVTCIRCKRNKVKQNITMINMIYQSITKNFKVVYPNISNIFICSFPYGIEFPISYNEEKEYISNISNIVIDIETIKPLLDFKCVFKSIIGTQILRCHEDFI